jgi:hypothetical protein
MSATQNNHRSLANLRPWVPGQTGNPGGRPKGIAARAREHTDKALETLVAALDDPDRRVAVTAANIILDRGWGKPQQNLSPEDAQSLSFLHLVAMRAINNNADGNSVIDAEHTDVSTDTNVSTRPDLREPATE